MPLKTPALKQRAKQAGKKPAKPLPKSTRKPSVTFRAKPRMKSGARPVKPAPKAVLPAAAKPAAKPPSQAAAAPTPALSTDCQQRSLANMRAFFLRTLASIEEADSAFTPMPGMFSAAQQVAHTAQTVDWFLEGAFSPAGFKMDFPGLEAEVRKVTSLAAARQWLDEAFGRFERALKERPASQWHECIVKDTIMGGAPRWSVVDGLADHTAHHRGALAVYARLLGKTPAMPYM